MVITSNLFVIIFFAIISVVLVFFIGKKLIKYIKNAQATTH